MKHTTLYTTAAFAALLSVAALGISAGVDSPRTLMSRGDYTAGRKAIEADTRGALARCRDYEGVQKDVCKAEARADERVKKADLLVRYHGTVAATADARLERVRASYGIAKARCGSHKGDQRMECLRAARQDEGKALAQFAAT